MKNLRAFLITSLISITFLHAQQSEICTVYSLERLQQEMPTFDEHTLVIFDRDDTLLQGIDCIRAELRAQFVEMWIAMYASDTPAAHKIALLRNIRSHIPVLVDETAPALIAQLQAQHVPVIILTRGCYGRNSIGLFVEDVCIAAFKSLGIDVSRSFPAYSGTILTSIRHNNNSPLFKRGILFSNTCDKGEALEALFQAMGWYPTRIIFVDDKKHYVEEVQRIAQKLDIPFLGLHYRGAEKLPAPDIEIQCYRMSYLLEKDLV